MAVIREMEILQRAPRQVMPAGLSEGDATYTMMSTYYGLSHKKTPRWQAVGTRWRHRPAPPARHHVALCLQRVSICTSRV